MRGLKPVHVHHDLQGSIVAPYVGAWIETIVRGFGSVLPGVAPYVGAWIETVVRVPHQLRSYVAPYVGAWIETNASPEH